MISVIVFGRNDNHGYNLAKRAAISLNCYAELLVHEDDEIIFVDYNSDDEVTTFVESIWDTLSDAAIQRIRTIRVRRSFHKTHFKNAGLPVVEPVCRNIGVRRANPKNPWILSTNTDIIPVLSGARTLDEMLADLPPGFYGTPRIDVPEVVWATFDRNDPAATLEKTRVYGKSLHLDEIVYGLDSVRYDGPGDFQLMRREAIFAIDGFDERMVDGWHVDSNIAVRMGLYYGVPAIGLQDRIFAYHCDHTLQESKAHGPKRQENDWRRFVMNVSEAGVSSQADNWGALAISFEEIAARRGPTPEIALLEDCLAPPLRGSYSSAYVPASYDASEFFPRHTLPFLVNVVCNQSPDVSISWFGGRSESYELFFKYLKSSRPAADLRLVALEHNASAVAAALESSDVFIFDFSSFTTNRENEFVLKALFAVEACEQDRRSPHTQPRPVVGVNVIHNEFERWFVGAVEANYSPFSSRIRVGFIRPRETEISLTRLFAAGPGARQHGYGQPVADGTRNGWYMEASHLASIPGVYRLVFELRANGTVTGAQPFGFIEARCGPDLMSVRWMTAEDLEKQTVSLDFVLSEASLLEGPPVTIRIKAISSIEFSVLDIRARRLSPEEASEFPDYGLCLGKDLLPIMSIGDAGDWIDSRVVSKLERSGHIVFGPNWSISPGRYVAKFHIENLSQGSSAMRTVVLEAGCGPVFFGQRDLSSFEISGRPQELRFSVPEGSSPKSFELRVWTSGEVAVALSHISIHSNAAEIDLPT